MSDIDLVYLATAPCGCSHGVDTEDSLDTALQVIGWIRAGSTVRRVTFAEAKARLAPECSHDPKWGRAS